MLYKVTKKYPRGPETPLNSFKSHELAKQYVLEKLAEDFSHRVQAEYFIYEHFDLIEKLDQSHLKHSEQDEQDSSSEGSKSSAGKSFNPTPLNTTPMPKGLPRSYTQDSKGDEKEKK